MDKIWPAGLPWPSRTRHRVSSTPMWPKAFRPPLLTSQPTPPQDAAEYAQCESLVKEYEPFIEAMKKRGVDDMELIMVDPWCVGWYSEEENPGRRLAAPLLFCRTESDCPMENG
jgi:hypothetical protein